mmetsp:Transcript_1644/g.6350  ORF Transcript_1644/g.6350 Transcript_1644/m.6350 type:complete len:154 (-) Transcript_1644:1029-1490(-)
MGSRRRTTDEQDRSRRRRRRPAPTLASTRPSRRAARRSVPSHRDCAAALWSPKRCAKKNAPRGRVVWSRAVVVRRCGAQRTRAAVNVPGSKTSGSSDAHFWPTPSALWRDEAYARTWYAHAKRYWDDAVGGQRSAHALDIEIETIAVQVRQTP